MSGSAGSGAPRSGVTASSHGVMALIEEVKGAANVDGGGVVLQYRLGS